MQPDQMLFLDQQEAAPTALAVEVGLDRLPDVVLEVDNTTDVRRGKLGLYEAWSFPEVWVEVPEHPAPGRRTTCSCAKKGRKDAPKGGLRVSPRGGLRCCIPSWSKCLNHAAWPSLPPPGSKRGGLTAFRLRR